MKTQLISSLFTLLLFLTVTLTSTAQSKTFTVGQDVAIKVLSGKWYFAKYKEKKDNSHVCSYTTKGGQGEASVPDANILTIDEAKAQHIEFENDPAKLSAATAVKPQDRGTLIQLINNYRKSQSVHELAADNVLNKAAQDYADLLERENKWGHYEPMKTKNGTVIKQVDDRVAVAALALAGENANAPFVFTQISPVAINNPEPNDTRCNVYVSENLGKGQGTPQEMLQAWQNSAGHNANMLNAKFTHVGIGISKCNCGHIGYIWVAVFGEKSSNNNAHLTLDGGYKNVHFADKFRYYTRFSK